MPFSAETLGREGSDQQRHLLLKRVVVADPPERGWQERQEEGQRKVSSIAIGFLRMEVELRSKS